MVVSKRHTTYLCGMFIFSKTIPHGKVVWHAYHVTPTRCNTGCPIKITVLHLKLILSKKSFHISPIFPSAKQNFIAHSLQMVNKALSNVVTMQLCVKLIQKYLNTSPSPSQKHKFSVEALMTCLTKVAILPNWHVLYCKFAKKTIVIKIK